MPNSSPPTYLQCPDFTTPPPPTGPLSLGSLITSPLDPFDTLNPNSIPPLSLSPHTTVQENFSRTHGDIKSGHVEFWAKLLEPASIGLKTGIHASNQSSDVFTIQRVETTAFQPTTEFLQSCLEAENVKRFVEGGRWRRKLYVVTGLKVAIGAKITTGVSNTKGADLSLDANLATVGIPAQAGFGIGGERTKSESTGFDSSTDILLGYRLRRVLYKKGVVTGSAVSNKGALLGNDDEAKEVDATVAIGLEEEDLGADDIVDKKFVTTFRNFSSGDTEDTEEFRWVVPK